VFLVFSTNRFFCLLHRCIHFLRRNQAIDCYPGKYWRYAGHGGMYANDPIDDMRANLKYETVNKPNCSVYEDFVNLYICSASVIYSQLFQSDLSTLVLKICVIKFVSSVCHLDTQIQVKYFEYPLMIAQRQRRRWIALTAADRRTYYLETVHIYGRIEVFKLLNFNIILYLNIYDVKLT